MAKKTLQTAAQAAESAESALQDTRFDVRVLETNLRRGRLTADVYQAYLDGLPDDADNCELVKVALT